MPSTSSRKKATFIPSVYPEGYVIKSWRPTKEQHERLRYWDFVLYWIEFHEKNGAYRRANV